MFKHDTAEIVRAFRNGNQQAFNQLVLLCQATIYNLALNYVKQEEEAKDLTQDIFVAAYKSLPQLREESKFSSWLYQIALNRCRNRYKQLYRKGFFTSLSIDDPDTFIQLQSDTSPEKELEKKRIINLVRETISDMPETEKEILILRDLQELSYEEISSTLDLPLGTVKSKLNRARTSLKNRLKNRI
ncbi:MAG: sigma-70 family RNA polymerase sigma factor [Proteobacteria bacterium]|nr:sigma-70 family RNA polymerase sigma factor [Pseudomonadota bacterium]MBU1710597.1 sigma-70 family RNA polymerase sigma factor [Pseudomonadota bacterium]